MTLYIKNMVCDRCLAAVERVFLQNELAVHRLSLGEVEVAEDPDADKLARVREQLEKHGFELLENKTARSISQIKMAVMEYVRNDAARQPTFSTFVKNKLGRDYPTLSQLFSSVEGVTIEQYLIRQKIEYVKELLVYDELSIKEIADKLHYSSVAHLSTQFKKITGLTPSYYKGVRHRTPLDKV